MWKVLVIICMAGYDCTAFQQSPMQYYHDYDECVSVAIEKEKQLTIKHTANNQTNKRKQIEQTSNHINNKQNINNEHTTHGQTTNKHNHGNKQTHKTRNKPI